MVHVVAACPTTLHLRRDLLAKVSKLLRGALQSSPRTTILNTDDPFELTCAILLSHDPSLPHIVNDSILKMTLHYIHKIHVYRLYSSPAD